MSDDPTRPIETPMTTPAAADPVAADPAAPAAAEATPTDAAAPAEAAPAEATATPVTVGRSGASRVRWAVAIVVAGLAIAFTIGAIVLFGQQTTPVALQYIPGDAAVVAEIRLDLPGDQMQRLGNLLAHFPGFADQATLTAKLDEALTKVVESASQGKASYVTDLKPWVNGPLFLAALNPSTSLASDEPRDMVISATTNGAVVCTSVFKDQAVTHETYKTLDLVVSSDGKMGCVVDGRQALLGDPATIRKALDTKSAGTGMDTSASYKAARTALGGDRLATVYVDGASLTKLMPNPADLGVPGLQALIGELPAWFMGGIRSEDDAFVLDYVAAHVPAPTGGPSFVAIPATHASVIAPMLPGDTLVYMEAQGAGAALQNLLTQLREIPDLAAALQMLDGVGGAAELVGWIDDAGVAVSLHGTTPDATILLVAKDETAAATRFASLKTLLALLGAGSGLEVKDSTISGVTVTTVTITDLGSIIPPGSVPGMGDIPTGPISFSLAAKGRVMLVTSGEGAMTAILNTAAGSSLAENAAYKHVRTRGIADARTTVYIGVGATVDLVKGLLPADALAQYQTEAAPYVEPFEAFLLQATSDAAGNRSRMVITVSQP
jgi:hypothetical protein